MSVRVKWLNRNTGYDSITIYRDVKSISPEALPDSLVVLSGGETEYLDTTAPTKVLLHYLIALKKGTEVTYSQPKPTMNIGYNGPGPQSIMFGDWRFGYFGQLTTIDLFTAAEVCAAVAIGGPTNVGGMTWFKFAFNGKVLYFPSAHLSQAVGWNLLYIRGLVFGVDDVGPTGHSNPPTNQMKKIAKGDDQFIVRLPRSNNTPGAVQGTIDLSGGLTVAEYALIYSVRNIQTGKENPVLNDLTSYMLTVAVTAPLAEFTAGALSQGCQHIQSGQFLVVTTNPASCVRSTQTYAWRPILEWVMP